jgi:hypothetical protein
MIQKIFAKPPGTQGRKKTFNSRLLKFCGLASLAAFAFFLFHAKAQRPQKKLKTHIILFSTWRVVFLKLEI